jgi:hypothetical protein
MNSRSQLVLRFVTAGIFLAMGIYATIAGSWFVAFLGFAVGAMWLVLGIRALREGARGGSSSRE